MKILVLNEDTEKALVHVMDVASKHPQAGGLAIHGVIQSLMQSVQEVAPAPGEEKSEVKEAPVEHETV